MVYKGKIRKRKIEKQEQSLLEINNGLQSTNKKKRKIEQQEQPFSEINNCLQRINQKT
jgi:hypothetical protein